MIDLTQQAALLVLQEIELLDLHFQEVPGPVERPDARCFKGETTDVLVTVAGFSIEDQGFPPGTFGHDGAVRKGGTIIRMTRDMAKRMYERACAQVPK